MALYLPTKKCLDIRSQFLDTYQEKIQKQTMEVYELFQLLNQQY